MCLRSLGQLDKDPDPLQSILVNGYGFFFLINHKVTNETINKKIKNILFMIKKENNKK
jgi:hypothetical protein